MGNGEQVRITYIHGGEIFEDSAYVALHLGETLRAKQNSIFRTKLSGYDVVGARQDYCYEPS